MYRVENYPEIQKSFFLLGRNEGASRKLCGKVAIITFFMQRGGVAWKKSSVDQYYSALNEAERFLEKSAAKYGTSLEFENYQFMFDIAENANPNDDFNLIKDFLRSKTVDEAQNYYEKRLGCDETPFILAYEEEGRSFARSKLSGKYDTQECSTVFRRSSGFRWQTLAHELLHQFGARDLYFPDEISKLADRYFGSSIMGATGDNVDDLTAYIIGWKNTISAHTYWFLHDSMWYTYDVYRKAVDAEWKKKY